MRPDARGDPPQTEHEGFLVYRRLRYLKVALLLCIASIAAYVWDDPPGGRNGGTWVGYGLGTLGALLIVWLTLLGVRKRRYRSDSSTVRGWASAHVYLGLALIVIATLHTAFEFGWNVHTVAYLLMCAVIVSGIYGVAAYTIYPRAITHNRADGLPATWLAELDELNEQSLKLADGIDPEVHRVIVRSIERTRIGGNLGDQLFGALKPGRRQMHKLQDLLIGRIASDASKKKPRRADPMSTVSFMAGQLATTDREAETAERTQRLLDLLVRRRALVDRLNRDIRLQGRMQIWLFFHVPLTFALLAALIAHIVTVFLYW